MEVREGGRGGGLSLTICKVGSGGCVMARCCALRTSGWDRGGAEGWAARQALYSHLWSHLCVPLSLPLGRSPVMHSLPLSAYLHEMSVRDKESRENPGGRT